MNQGVQRETSLTDGVDLPAKAQAGAARVNGDGNAFVAPWRAGKTGNSAAVGLAAVAHSGSRRNVGVDSAGGADVDIAHSDDLFRAVKARLRNTVDVHLTALTLPLADVAADQIRRRVLECVSALDQLHMTLTNEADRRYRLELELFEARSALAQARSELVCTCAEEVRSRHMALHDGLTHLPNRNHFHDRLTEALALSQATQQSLAVLYLDLDGFKPINDAHGHETGDALLKIVAARLTRTVREEDMASRVGGDEFACLLGGIPTRDQLAELARKLVCAISATVQIGHLVLQVRPSIGIALCPADVDSADALLKTADAAMYRAKRRQTGYAFFDELSDESKAGTL